MNTLPGKLFQMDRLFSTIKEEKDVAVMVLKRPLSMTTNIQKKKFPGFDNGGSSHGKEVVKTTGIRLEVDTSPSAEK